MSDDPFDMPAGKADAWVRGTATDPDRYRQDWQRPATLNPRTGKVEQYQRATTLAKTGSDDFGLSDWRLRMLAKGMATGRDDLIKLASCLDPEDSEHKKTYMTEIIEPALDRAGANAGRKTGTALHDFSAKLDTGMPVTLMPTWVQPHMRSYMAAMKDAGVRVVPGLIERFTIAPDVGAAGTMDRGLYRADWGAIRIGDVKGAKDLDYSQEEIEVQLSIYARGLAEFGVWQRDGSGETPNPGTWSKDTLKGLEVDLDCAVVIWLPNNDDSRCILRKVNIERGWKLARQRAVLRDQRKAIKREGWKPLEVQVAAGPVVLTTTSGNVIIAPESLADTIDAAFPVDPLLDMAAQEFAMSTMGVEIIARANDGSVVAYQNSGGTFTEYAPGDVVDIGTIPPTIVGCPTTLPHWAHGDCKGIKGRRTKVQTDIDAARRLAEAGQPVSGPGIDAAVAAGLEARKAQDPVNWAVNELDEIAEAARAEEANAASNAAAVIAMSMAGTDVPEEVFDDALATLDADPRPPAQARAEDAFADRSVKVLIVDPVIVVRAKIKKARTRPELSAIRGEYIAAGREWTDDLTTLGLAVLKFVDQAR